MTDIHVRCDAARTNNNTEYRVTLYRNVHPLDAETPDEKFFITVESTDDGGATITTNTDEEYTTTLHELPAEEREEVLRIAQQVVAVNIQRTREFYPESALNTDE